MLRCSKCRKDKQPEEFGIDNSNSRGHQYQCRKCKTTPSSGARLPKAEECGFETCLRPPVALGLCQTHRRHLKQGKPLKEIVWRKRTGGECEFPECDRVQYSQGLCDQHSRKRAKGQELKPLRVKNSYRISSWEYHLRSKYRMSWQDFARLLLLQEFKCAICDRQCAGGWYVDHDHVCCSDDNKTCGNCVRGLLCSNCNSGLGHFRDNPRSLERAAAYIKASGSSRWAVDAGEF